MTHSWRIPFVPRLHPALFGAESNQLLCPGFSQKMGFHVDTFLWRNKGGSFSSNCLKCFFIASLRKYLRVRSGKHILCDCQTVFGFKTIFPKYYSKQNEKRTTNSGRAIIPNISTSVHMFICTSHPCRAKSL